MEQFNEFVQIVAELVRQHVPSGAVPPALPTAAVLLVFGVAICSLGAKLARWFITVLFAVGGLVAALSLGERIGASPLIMAILGAGAGGSLGFFLHRFLVGLFTGAFLASVAFSVLSAEMVIPHLVDFDRAVRATPVTDFHPGPPAEEAGSGWDQLEGYAERFENYLMEHEPNIRKYAAVCVLGAGVLGFLMGVFLCRLTLILFTAAFGMFLIGAGTVLVGGYVGIDFRQMLEQRPAMIFLAIGAAFIVSVLLQTAMTRPERVVKVVEKPVES